MKQQVEKICAKSVISQTKTSQQRQEAGDRSSSPPSPPPFPTPIQSRHSPSPPPLFPRFSPPSPRKKRRTNIAKKIGGESREGKAGEKRKRLGGDESFSLQGAARCREQRGEANPSIGRFHFHIAPRTPRWDFDAGFLRLSLLPGHLANLVPVISHVRSPVPT